MDTRYDDIVQLLQETRCLSTWGPDFNKEQVQNVWVEALDGIDLADLRSALKALRGKKDFPLLTEIKAMLRGTNKTQNNQQKLLELYWQVFEKVSLPFNAIEQLHLHNYLSCFVSRPNSLNRIKELSIDELKQRVERNKYPHYRDAEERWKKTYLRLVV